MNNSQTTKECEASNMLLRLFLFQDFEHNINNPFFLTYSNGNYTDNNISNYDEMNAKINFPTVFFTVCYAYSIFRIFINVTKIIYSDKKIKIIFRD
jgi:hypothetical protein